MEWPAIVTLLAIAEYVVFSMRVGLSRDRFGVPAPATSGHPEWERRFRVHQNTLEQLAVFLPSLWIFSTYVSPVIGAGLGVLFLVGRLVYAAAYQKEPSGRTAGFLMGFFANVLLLLGGLGGAIRSLL